jgi:hypothetical protein
MNEGASLLTTTQLKERGWTPALVKKFLGAPEVKRPNPYYRSAAPMQLYPLERVLEVEQTAEWRQAEARAAMRSEAGKIAAARKAASLVAQAETLPITVRRLPLATLLRRASASSHAFHERLEEVAGRIGVEEETALIRQRVYAEIVSIYPEYAEECKRQLLFRHGEAS